MSTATGAPLRDLSRITLGTDNNPTSRAGEMDFEAELVHRRLRSAAEEQDDKVKQYDGNVGYYWEGYITDVFHLLWADSSPVVGYDNFEDARSAVTEYLKANRNIACIQRGQQSAAAGKRRVLPSRWWIRAKYAGVQITHTAPRLPKPKEPTPIDPKPVVVIPEPPKRDHNKTVYIYPCREPGCTSEGFLDTATRSRHEYEQHPDSTARVWYCYHNVVDGKRTCPEAFYNLGSLAVHTVRLHKIGKTDDEYKKIIAMSKATAEGTQSVSPYAEEAVSNVTEPVTVPTPPLPPVPSQVPPTPPSWEPASAITDYRAALTVLTSLVEENEQLRADKVKLEEELAKAQEGGDLRGRLFDLLRQTAPQ
jgi:hypothetical protein